MALPLFNFLLKPLGHSQIFLGHTRIPQQLILNLREERLEVFSAKEVVCKCKSNLLKKV